ncbi:hypothetical protein NIES3806_42140 [Microcystis aeruginosa NIES-3806]|nr:hypothetical protein NIES3806_42140 [Microcystis aeruginosa NIES-3806]
MAVTCMLLVKLLKLKTREPCPLPVLLNWRAWGLTAWSGRLVISRVKLTVASGVALGAGLRVVSVTATVKL